MPLPQLSSKPGVVGMISRNPVASTILRAVTTVLPLDEKFAVTLKDVRLELPVDSILLTVPFVKCTVGYSKIC